MKVADFANVVLLLQGTRLAEHCRVAGGAGVAGRAGAICEIFTMVLAELLLDSRDIKTDMQNNH